MAKGIATGNYSGGTKKKRPGIHSKNNTSKLKSSKNYVKSYRGQGK
jgi:hypothetical protein